MFNYFSNVEVFSFRRKLFCKGNSHEKLMLVDEKFIKHFKIFLIKKVAFVFHTTVHEQAMTETKMKAKEMKESIALSSGGDKNSLNFSQFSQNISKYLRYLRYLCLNAL